MKIIEALNIIDGLKPNTYTQSQKVRWLSELDQHIKNEIIDSHENAADGDFNGYNDDTPLETEMIVPSPYDEMYITYLSMKIDYHNAEFSQYNNNASLYNSQLSNFANYYNRRNMPLTQKLKFF